MSDLKEWMNPLIPADTRVQIADGEIDSLRAELAASREREARMKQDAERYRWLRSRANADSAERLLAMSWESELDELIDAALAEGAQR